MSAKFDSEFDSLVTIAEMPEVGGRTVKPFSLSQARGIATRVREEWGEYLTPSFDFTVTELDSLWKIVAKDSRGFRRSAMLAKKKTFEARMVDALNGLLTEYFIHYDNMPRSWGHE